MSMTLIVIIAVFICVTAVVGALVMMFRQATASTAEDRLDQMTSGSGSSLDGKLESPLLTKSLDELSSSFVGYFTRLLNLRVFLEQAGTKIEPSKFLAVVGLLAGGGAMACIVLPQLPIVLAPVLALVLAAVPFVWLRFKRKKRLKMFAKQLPEALELIARALRAGHSLASGLHLVATEMSDPIGQEFARCYDEQNLGIPLEDTLEDLADRIPNLDLRFFVTAVNLQRQTGGDLSEILDKIGTLVRQRFKIWGQVQALTGEGRLSGIVLLSLPPVLFLVILKINPSYVMKLFNEPLGHKMLAVAIAMQIAGAIVIKKIVNIKV